ncbi:hypothetical protein BV898_10648 [Hypsibius exemplaris]|uniref:Uncharacterized protein n=1 Tax=Hypsibius exemplaris TaxID=2072580 RepID=A0A1W0WJ27_HYPEX|nr:hypothetical protein BV898_10648 [Hypsibius exemplaris]
MDRDMGTMNRDLKMAGGTSSSDDERTGWKVEDLFGGRPSGLTVKHRTDRPPPAEDRRPSAPGSTVSLREWTAKYRDKWRDNFLTSFCCPNRQQREVLAENVTVVELSRSTVAPPVATTGHGPGTRWTERPVQPIAMISCKSVPRQHVITTSPPSKVCGLVMDGQIVSRQFVPLYAYPEIS